jgi:hypothetical protein
LIIKMKKQNLIFILVLIFLSLGLAIFAQPTSAANGDIYKLNFNDGIKKPFVWPAPWPINPAGDAIAISDLWGTPILLDSLGNVYGFYWGAGSLPQGCRAGRNDPDCYCKLNGVDFPGDGSPVDIISHMSDLFSYIQTSTGELWKVHDKDSVSSPPFGGCGEARFLKIIESSAYPGSQAIALASGWSEYDRIFSLDSDGYVHVAFSPTLTWYDFYLEAGSFNDLGSGNAVDITSMRIPEDLDPYGFSTEPYVLGENGDIWRIVHKEITPMNWRLQWEKFNQIPFPGSPDSFPVAITIDDSLSILALRVLDSAGNIYIVSQQADKEYEYKKVNDCSPPCPFPGKQAADIAGIHVDIIGPSYEPWAWSFGGGTIDALHVLDGKLLTGPTKLKVKVFNDKNSNGLFESGEEFSAFDNSIGQVVLDGSIISPNATGDYQALISAAPSSHIVGIVPNEANFWQATDCSFSDGAPCSYGLVGSFYMTSSFSVAKNETLTVYLGVKSNIFDYSLSNSGNITLVQGQSGSVAITANLISGASQAVSFDLSGLPANTTFSFSPPSCSPPCQAQLTINTFTAPATPINADPGFLITVSGSPLSATTSFSLFVLPSLSKFDLTCQSDPSRAIIYEPVTWRAEASAPGAPQNYTFEWSGAATYYNCQADPPSNNPNYVRECRYGTVGLLSSTVKAVNTTTGLEQVASCNVMIRMPVPRWREIVPI